MSDRRSTFRARSLLATALTGLLTLGLAAVPPSVQGAPRPSDGAKVATGPLVAADSLGRILAGPEEAPSARPDRTVGMFYFPWHGTNDMRDYKNVHDLSKALADDPEAWRDATDDAFPPPNHFAYWGEPLFGYYRGDDEWVVRRHLQMLADAQVDYLVFDATNQEIFKPQAQLVMELIVELQADGVAAPQLVFMTRSNSTAHMDEIFETFYAPDAPARHPSTWFMWDGKPLIMGVNPSPTVSDFFTFRFTQWPNQPQDPQGWDWISFDRPQRGNHTADDSLEQMAVSTAQNSGGTTAFSNTAWYETDDPKSRSKAFNNGAEDPNPEAAVLAGANFQEEWDYAIETDPETVFVTGWNEWIAGNWGSPDGPMLFYDVVDMRWNRDIEPMVGGYKDNYYLQLIDNIRRYKGVNPHDNVTVPKTINLNKGMNDWRDVGPVYTDYAHDTDPRNHPGVDERTYVNESGRNDIRTAKVARDDEHVFFLVTTRERLTQPDETWMHLYLDINDDLTDNWAGYDVRVVFDDRGQAMLQSFTADGWQDQLAVESNHGNSELVVRIPRAALGLEEEPMRLAFKWWDNAGDDIMDAYSIGDAAPEGRFSYLYDTSDHEPGVVATVPEVEPVLKPVKGTYRIEDSDRITDTATGAGTARWHPVKDPASSGGTHLELHNPTGEQDVFYRSWVRAGFRGDSVSWIAPTGPQGAHAEVFIDGLSQGVVDLYSASWKPQQTVFSVQGLVAGYHEIMVVFRPDAGTYYHDAFEVGVGRPGMIQTKDGLEAGQNAWATASGFSPIEFRPVNPSQANDGDLGTWWRGTRPNGDHLELALGIPRDLRQVHLTPRAGSEATVTHYHVEAIAPNGRWSTIATGTDLTEPKTFEVQGVTTDRVRLVIDETEGGLPEIAEFSLGVPEFDGAGGTHWEFTNSTEEWVSSGSLSDLLWIEDGAVSAELSGVGAFQSPDSLEIDAAEFSSMALRWANQTGATSAAVTFEAVAADGTTTAGRQEFHVEANAGTRAYVVNLADAEGWVGTITRIGLELVDGTGTVVLDHVRLAPDHAAWASHFADGDDGWRVSGASIGTLEPGFLSLEATSDVVELTSPEGIGADVANAEFVSVRVSGLEEETTIAVNYSTSASSDPQTVSQSFGGAAGWRTIQIPMTGAPGWSGRLDQLELSITPTLAGQSILVDAIRVENFSLAPIVVRDAWEFESDTEGWFPEVGISDFEWSEPGVVGGEIWYTDSRILSQDYLWLDLSDKTTVTIGLQNQTPGEIANLYFLTMADGRYGANKGVTFDVIPNDDQITTYVLDVGALPTWTGTLRQLRLDPVEGATGSFVLDFIRIGRGSEAEEPVEVSPAAVTFADEWGTADDEYAIPVTEGVEYLVDGAVVAAGTYPGVGTVTVTARAVEGFVLAEGAVSEWSFTFSTEVEPVEVTPAAVTFADEWGTADDEYTIPVTEGVEYLVDGAVVAAGTYPGVGTVTVTARAVEGFVLAEDADSEWSHTFSSEVEPTDPRDPATSAVASVTLQGRDANAWGTVNGEASVSTQVKLPNGQWSTSQTREPDEDGFYVIPLTYGKQSAGTLEWRVRVTYADGTIEYGEPMTQTRVARTSVAVAPTTVVGRDANAWGTVAGAATVSTQVRLPDGTWSTSQIRETDSDGFYVIPLTYGKHSAGTLQWRVHARHDNGLVETTSAVTQERVHRPSAAHAGSKRVGENTYVWGSVNVDAPTRVFTQVYINGAWSTSQIGRTSPGGGYTLELTYGKHQGGTYRYRVGADYPGIGVVYSDEFALVRTIR